MDIQMSLMSDYNREAGSSTVHVFMVSGQVEMEKSLPLTAVDWRGYRGSNRELSLTHGC